MTALLELRGVSRVLSSKAMPVTLVRDANAKISPGEFVAIVGPSGCGKSSLLYLLGLLDRPTSGEVLIDGEATRDLSSAARGELRLARVGFVFQFHFLLAEFSALDNVAMPMRRLARLSEREIVQRAGDLLTGFGLGASLGKKPDQLSGGQRQRIAVARALANEPDIILCDEPTGNLDSVNAATVIDALQNLAHVEQRAVVCVTHDPGIAARADRRIGMRDGRIVPTEAVAGHLVG